MPSFGELVRAQRKRRDLTQEQLAELVGCSVDLIRKIERGSRRPSRETAERIARLLGVEGAAGFVAAAREPLPAPARPGLAAPPRLTPPPAPAGPLLGRAAELARLSALLADPGCRLVSLLGPGGIGKTRLALEAARTLAPPAGAAFASLEAVEAPELLGPALAEALGLSLAAAGDPLGQIAAQLGPAPPLLLIDNFEQLAPHAGLLADLLARAPGLRLLVTSRERLGLAGEWAIELGGLPERGAGSGLELLGALVSRARGGAGLRPGERAAAAAICRMVEGSPLAIELAAAWAGALSLPEIAAEVGRSLDFLSRGRRDLPDRQRGLRAVFQSSWARLEPALAAALARPAVFAGGFDRRAAAEVAGAGLTDLAALIDRSLLVRRADGRYAAHGLLRAFAAEQLSAPEAAALRLRHARHYAGRLGAALPGLRGPGQAAALAELLPDAENIRAAWAELAARADGEAIGAAYKALWYLCEIRGWQREAARMFAVAEEALGPEGPLGAELPAAEGWMLMRAGRHAEARQALERALGRARALGPGQPLATALDYLGLLDLMAGRYAPAAAALAESLGIHLADGNAWGAAFARGYLGLLAVWGGDPAAGLPLLREAAAAMRGLGDPRGLASCLLLLGGALAQAGDPAEAEGLLRECLALAAGAGDRWSFAAALGYLGLAARRGGADPAEARYLIAEGAALMAELGDPWGEGLLRAIA